MDSADLETLPTRRGTLRVFRNDTGAVGQSLRRYGEWAENELRFLHQFVREGAIVLDIGAYLGTHALAFAAMAGPSGRVIAFEAQPDSHAVLCENLAANAAHTVTAHHAAAGPAAGRIAIAPLTLTATGNYGGASIRPGAAATIEVPMRRIDDLALTRCDLIKIDAEGSEAAVLEGAKQTLRAHHPVIYAECNSLADGIETLARLHEAGYRVRLHVVDAFNPDNFTHTDENLFGPARECALLGLPQTAPDPRHPSGSQELLLEVVTADDLALGLLNKPQYKHEILAVGKAAASGGFAVFEAIAATENALQAARTDLAYLQSAREAAECEARANAAFAAKYAALQAAHADLTAEFAQTRATLAARGAALAASQADLAAARAEAQRAILAASSAEARLADLRASRSWRLTAPLRALARRLRGR